MCLLPGTCALLPGKLPFAVGRITSHAVTRTRMRSGRIIAAAARRRSGSPISRTRRFDKVPRKNSTDLAPIWIGVQSLQSMHKRPQRHRSGRLLYPTSTAPTPPILAQRPPVVRLEVPERCRPDNCARFRPLARTPGSQTLYAAFFFFRFAEALGFDTTACSATTGFTSADGR